MVSILDKLPPELLNSVLECMDWRELVDTRAVSRLFRTIVDNSPAFQYKIALSVAGFEDGHHLATPTEKLQLLSAHQEAWRIMQNTSETTIDQTHGGLWELYSGILAQVDQDQNFLFYRLSSSLRRIPYQEWTVRNPGLLVRDFGMDYSQNLLVLLENPIWTISRNYRIHLRKILDGNAHPDAQVPVIELEQDHEDPTISYSLQISGDHLGVLFLSNQRARPNKLCVWNWKSGEMLLHVESPSIISFVFFSEQHVILPVVDGSRVLLKVINFLSAGSSRSPLGSIRQSWTFGLPVLSSYSGLRTVTIRCDPAPGWRPSEAEAPFLMTGSERLFVATLDGWGQGRRSVPAILFLTSGLMKFVRAHDGSGSLIEWENWGPSNTRILDLPFGLSDTWVCYTFGKKFVYPRPDSSGRSTREPDLFLDVYDFNQLAIRKESKTSGESPEEQNPPSTPLFQSPVQGLLPYRRTSIPITRFRWDLESWMLSQDSIILVSTEDKYHILNF